MPNVIRKRFPAGGSCCIMISGNFSFVIRWFHKGRKRVLIVRDATLSDAARLLEIYDPYVQNTAISFAYETPSLEEFKARMEKTMRRYPYFVAEKDGRVEGYAYAGSFIARAAYDHSCELTIYLAQGLQKCGMGRALGYKFGRWYDMIWMEKIIGEHEAAAKAAR